MEKRPRWQPMEIDLKAFMNFVRSKGAASIKEIKDHFHTDSASARRAIGFLYHHNKVWLVAYGGGIYVTENTGRKGKVNISYLRKQAGVVAVKPGPKAGKNRKVVERTPSTETSHTWEDEKGNIKVDLAEDW